MMAKIKKYFLLFSILFLSFVVVQATISIYCITFAYAKVKKDSDEVSENDNNGGDYFNLKPLIMSVMRQDGSTAQLSLLISIDIGDGDMKELNKYRSRLRSSYIQNLYTVLGSDYNSYGGNLIDVELVRSNLLQATQEVLGERYEVKDIILHVVQQGNL